jgi:hypothetical protein
MWNSYYDCFAYLRMRDERRFNFTRIYIFSAGDVHLLSPPAYREKPIATANREIASAEPPAGSKRFISPLLVVEITSEHLRPSQQELTGLSLGNVTQKLVDEPHLEKRNRPANLPRIVQ